MTCRFRAPLPACLLAHSLIATGFFRLTTAPGARMLTSTCGAAFGAANTLDRLRRARGRERFPALAASTTHARSVRCLGVELQPVGGSRSCP